MNINDLANVANNRNKMDMQSMANAADNRNKMNINDLANAANNRNKMSKAKMYVEYTELVECLDKTDITDITDGRIYDILTNMYNYFQPGQPAKPKTVEQWLSKAMADKKDARYYLQYIYSDGDNLVATDGHRLHIHYGTTYPAGFYDANMQPIQVDAKYPDFNLVIPANREGNKYLTVYKDELMHRDVQVIKGQELINVVDDIWVNKKYLSDALCFFDPTEPLELIYLDATSSIAIKYMDYLAVVMPCRV